MDKKSRLSTNINADMNKFTKLQAVKEDTTQAQIIERAIKNTYGEQLKNYINNKEV